MPPINSRKDWQKLLGENKIESLINALLQHAEAIDAKAWKDELFLLQNRHERLQEKRRLELNPPEQLSWQYNQVSHALLSILNSIPLNKAAIKQALRQKQLTLRSFQRFFFIALLGIKIIVFLFVLFYYSVGGLSPRETAALTLLLLPVLVGYYPLRRGIENAKVLRPVVWVSRWSYWEAGMVLGIYLVYWVVAMGMKTSGDLGEVEGFAFLMGLLIGGEIGLGVHVGQLLVKRIRML